MPYYKNMKKHYIVQKTENRLLSIEGTGGAYRNRHVKDSIMDMAQLAYLSLKQTYGINYVISAKALQEKMGCAESTFNDNFCGGINGFLSMSEEIVINRFAEAVEASDPNLTSALYVGFKALVQVNPHSQYNVYQVTAFDMSLRSHFAAEAFSSDYWREVLEPLTPAIYTFLAESIPAWDDAPETIKEWVYVLAANFLREEVKLLVLGEYTHRSMIEQTRLLKDYVMLFKKLLLGSVRMILMDRFQNTTEIMRIMDRGNSSADVN